MFGSGLDPGAESFGMASGSSARRDELVWLEMLVSKNLVLEETVPFEGSYLAASPLALCEGPVWDASGSEEGSRTPSRSPAGGFGPAGPRGGFAEGTGGVWLGTALHVSTGSAGAVGTQPPSSWSGSQPRSTGSSGDNSDSLKRGDKSSSPALA